MKLPSVTTIALLVYPLASLALNFQSYVNERGETIFTNLPPGCVKDSRLTCMQYHPLLAKQKTLDETGEAAPAKSSQRKPAQAAKPAAASPGAAKPLVAAPAVLKGIKGLIEANKILDELYPAGGGPAGANAARR